VIYALFAQNPSIYQRGFYLAVAMEAIFLAFPVCTKFKVSSNFYRMPILISFYCLNNEHDLLCTVKHVQTMGEIVVTCCFISFQCRQDFLSGTVGEFSDKNQNSLAQLILYEIIYLTRRQGARVSTKYVIENP